MGPYRNKSKQQGGVSEALAEQKSSSHWGKGAYLTGFTCQWELVKAQE